MANPQEGHITKQYSPGPQLCCLPRHPGLQAWPSSPLSLALILSRVHTLQGMAGEYVPQSGPVGINMAQPSYTPPQMAPHPSQLRHRPPMHPYLPSHAHHPAMLMHGGPPPHPGMTMSAQSPSILTPIDPSAGGQVLDIHAQ
ncbi:hypothetical protein JZ751_003038 [Albula glossodonta]|uniref:Uncharacterized protein n=1 Tax=Albula glossodonta TaxID=121402 RepID=A0A8T2NBI3_9TELE|nr:hypothetical protein JZ751_003038 [Albula glossodonta]